VQARNLHVHILCEEGHAWERFGMSDANRSFARRLKASFYYGIYFAI
jgi:hypothetical protein